MTIAFNCLVEKHVSYILENGCVKFAVSNEDSQQCILHVSSDSLTVNT